MSLLELFCSIDDFWQVYEPIWHQTLLESGQGLRRRAISMSMSEMMTIVVHFHQKQYRNFKTYYTDYVMTHLMDEFPDLLAVACEQRSGAQQGERAHQQQEPRKTGGPTCTAGALIRAGSSRHTGFLTQK